MDLTYHIRQVGPCLAAQKPVGTHEGKFKIFNPAGALIGIGRMKGTNGLETHAISGECCAWPHDEGCMEGNVKCPEGICKLIATYASDPDASSTPTDLCNVQENWWYWIANIDGILLCPCKPGEHD